VQFPWLKSQFFSTCLQVRKERQGGLRSRLGLILGEPVPEAIERAQHGLTDLSGTGGQGQEGDWFSVRREPIDIEMMSRHDDSLGAVVNVANHNLRRFSW
jgi:hypothetical protein